MLDIMNKFDSTFKISQNLDGKNGPERKKRPLVNSFLYLFRFSSSLYLIFIPISFNFSPSIRRSSNPLPEFVSSSHPPHPLFTLMQSESRLFLFHCGIAVDSIEAKAWFSSKQSNTIGSRGARIFHLRMVGGCIARLNSSEFGRFASCSGGREMALVRRVSSSFPRVAGFANRSLYSLNSPDELLDSPTSSSLAHGIHVFHCPDSVGIVAKLSECIASRGGNILNADIFVPENKNVFYSRSKFLFDPCKWPRMQMDEDFLKISKTFNAWKSVVWVPDQDPKYKLAILASKQDHCLVDLLHQWQGGKLPVEITCVVSNHDRAPNTHVMHFLERHGIAYHYLQTYKDNKREGEILELVKNTDFLVLARYMQVLSGDFLRSYGNDIINIHHGLLPSFKGSNPSKQAFNAGVKLIGATTHFVTEELDAGPIIEQMVERVSHRDNLQSFVQKSENLEKQCLTNAIKSYCELRVLPYEKNRTVVF